MGLCLYMALFAPYNPMQLGGIPSFTLAPKMNVLKFGSPLFLGPRLIHQHKADEEGGCVSVKREIASNLAVVDIQLNCDMLSGLNSKSDNQCLREEASAFQLFQEHQVYKRLQLTPDKYFSQLKTTAFKKVSFFYRFSV